MAKQRLSTAPSTMEPSYPEMALFTDMIDLRSRIEELAPLTPSATPRQKGYRDFLQALLKTLPDSIPGQDDHSDSSRDPDDAGGAGQVAQNDDLNLLGQRKKTTEERRAENVSNRVARIAESFSMPPISPEVLAGLISKPDFLGERSESEDRALGRFLTGYVDTESGEWSQLLGVYQDPSFEWGDNIQLSNRITMVRDQTERLRGRSSCIDKTREWENGTGFLPCLFAQIQAIRWAIDWERAPNVRGWKKQHVTENFQSLPENVALFEGKSEDERQALMVDLEASFETYRRTVKGENAASMRLLEMYRYFGPGVLLDRYWDTRFNTESRSKDFSNVFQQFLSLIATVDSESCAADGSVVYSIQEGNRAVLLSVVEVLAGDLFGAELREYVEEFLEDTPTRIIAPSAPSLPLQ